MSVLLQILGGLFLVIITVAALIALLVAYRVRQLFTNLRKMAEFQMPSAAPPRIHLDRLAAPAWADAEGVKAQSQPLPGLGFQEAGLYSVREISGLQLQGWVNPEQSAFAVVYEHPVAGISLDVVTRYQDGTRVTYTNTHAPSGLDHMPGHQLERFPGLDPAELHIRFLEGRPVRVMERVSAAAFAALFEKAYADEMDWRNSRGGPTQTEIRSVMNALGQSYDDQIVEATRRTLQQQAFADLEQTLREQFLRQTNMPASEWEQVRDRLVIIHDQLSLEALTDKMTDALDEDVGEQRFEAPISSPRRIFAAWNERLPPDRRLQKLGEVNEPVVADVYCAQEE